ncbi:MAG TPA: SIS domain-containing protein [Acidimicrobiales bacterium]|nr:SIS domain-containing protein [Acidimicrobiales bacterium]
MSDTGGESTAFLYPFIEGDEREVAPLLTSLEQSAVAKATASAELRAATSARMREQVARLADIMAARFVDGARLFTFGNGGSSTDAASLAELFARPPWGRPLPARSLVDDSAVVTALGNDVGFDLVFSRQLIAYGAPGDIAVGISTSGSSRNVLTAFAEARTRGMITVGLAGYDGGEMAAAPDLQHCLVVRSDSVHRIQETQAGLGFSLWAAIQQRLDDAGG